MYKNNGLLFQGRQSELEIIVNCLNRVGLEQNINTSINIYYTGLATNTDPLDNVFLNADRFVKNDGETILDCESVFALCFREIWCLYYPTGRGVVHL